MAAPEWQPVPIKGPVVALCEGQHDAAFLLAVARQIGRESDIDLPFFALRDGRRQWREGVSTGAGAIPTHLKQIALQLYAAPADAAKVRGILLLRDCGDDPAAVLRQTDAACRDAGVAPPAAVDAWHGAGNGPQTAVLLLPEPARRGSLETLCLGYLRTHYRAAAACLDAYFACIGPPAPAVTVEKGDKARLACLIAAINPGNPTQTLSGAFSGTPPLIDVTDPQFTPFATVLGALLGAVPPR